jgi:hypothetical protein
MHDCDLAASSCEQPRVFRPVEARGGSVRVPQRVGQQCEQQNCERHDDEQIARFATHYFPSILAVASDSDVERFPSGAAAPRSQLVQVAIRRRLAASAVLDLERLTCLF